MFLDRLVARNRDFVIAAVALHQAGRVLANTYLIDLDMLRRNAAVIRDAASQNSLMPYFMAKQFGRNPDACKVIAETGIEKAVAVDLQEMDALLRGGSRIGHVGHLVQSHRGSEDAVIRAEPDVVTVFSIEVAERLGRAATRAGRVQDILLRVTGPGDFFYFGHGGGFPFDDIQAAAKKIDAIDGLSVAGVTTFPCLLGDPEAKQVRPTPNFSTLREAGQRLSAAGFELRQVNAPGTNSAQTMVTLREHGATHVEPGNALHGTTPMHIFDPDAPELPAILYVSEISHIQGDGAYAFAAGLYIDKVLGDYPLRALCGRDEDIIGRTFRAESAPDGAIHYYCVLRLPGAHDVSVGDTVIFCFRPQTFVTRARTQAVADIHAGEPQPLAVYDQEARMVEGKA
jgi:predicted amino acid racemase